MSTSDIPLDAPEAWIGTWVRYRSGPTLRGATITVDRWHRVSEAGERLTTVCGRVGLRGLLWPGGGSRLEVARPYDATALPGDVCPRCMTRRIEEVEQQAPSEEFVDLLVERVVARLRETTDA